MQLIAYQAPVMIKLLVPLCGISKWAPLDTSIPTPLEVVPKQASVNPVKVIPLAAKPRKAKNVPAEVCCSLTFEGLPESPYGQTKNQSDLRSRKEIFEYLYGNKMGRWMTKSDVWCWICAGSELNCDRR